MPVSPRSSGLPAAAVVADVVPEERAVVHEEADVADHRRRPGRGRRAAVPVPVGVRPYSLAASTLLGRQGVIPTNTKASDDTPLI